MRYEYSTFNIWNSHNAADRRAEAEAMTQMRDGGWRLCHYAVAMNEGNLVQSYVFERVIWVEEGKIVLGAAHE